MTRESLKAALAAGPVFAVTADMDWASEEAISLLLKAFVGYGIKPTLFLTHESRVAKEASEQGAAELALHPNFLPKSSHGCEPAEVINCVKRIVPQARGSRAHSYVSSTPITKALVSAGVCYDSGPLCFLQQGLVPLNSIPGLVHLPVFWEDDVHWTYVSDWSFQRMRDKFLEPGLKIIDMHPFFYALNIPDAAFYQKHKSLIPDLTSAQAQELRHPGQGCADFSNKLLALIAENGGAYTLGEIYDWACEL